MLRPAQMRMLHAEARKRGLSHADLRDLAFGTSPAPASFSLRDLDQRGFDRLLNQLAVPLRPKKAGQQRRPRRAKGTLALASPAQRKYLSDLYLALAPRITAERLLHYLRHHGIPIDESNGVPQFRHGPYSNIAARAAITQFEQLRAKCGTGVPPVDVQETVNT